MSRYFSSAHCFCLLLSLVFAACGGSSKTPETDQYKAIETSFEKSGSTTAASSPESKEPVKGVDVAALKPELAVRFETLLDTLPSPCGKGHALRTSSNEDKSCKRAPFAVTYSYELVKDGATDAEVKELYRLRFRDVKIWPLRYDSTSPRSGPEDAPVKIVEFFDYGCPACARFHPLLEEVAKGLETSVAIYFRNFPLSSHVDSAGAAQAALAAHKQGKFGEMHLLLFENQHSHKMMDLVGYAKEIGLDVPRFRKDYKDVDSLVKADRAEGESVGVNGTPAVYINGREYEGPADPKYFKMWVEESLAGAF